MVDEKQRFFKKPKPASFDQFFITLLNNGFRKNLKEYYSRPDLQWKDEVLFLFAESIDKLPTSNENKKQVSEDLCMAIREYEDLWKIYLQQNDRVFSNLTTDRLPAQVLKGDVYKYRKTVIAEMAGNFFQNIFNEKFLRLHNKLKLLKFLDKDSFIPLEDLKFKIFDKLDPVYQKIIMDKIRNRDQRRQNLETDLKDSYDFEYLTLGYFHRLLVGEQRENGDDFKIRARKSHIEDDHFHGIDLSLAFGNDYEFCSGVDTTLNPDKVAEKIDNARNNTGVSHVYSGTLGGGSLQPEKAIDKFVVYLSPEDFGVPLEEIFQHLQVYLFSEASKQYEKTQSAFMVEYQKAVTKQSPELIKESQRIGKTFEKRLYQQLCEKIYEELFAGMSGSAEFRNLFNKTSTPRNYNEWKKFLDQVTATSEQVKLFGSQSMHLKKYLDALSYLLSSQRLAKILK